MIMTVYIHPYVEDTNHFRVLPAYPYTTCGIYP